MYNIRSTIQRGSQIGEFDESIAASSVHETAEDIRVGDEVVFESISTDRLPTLIRVDESAKRRVLKPNGHLVDYAEKSLVVK